MVIEPDVGAYRQSSNEAIVDLPQPLAPTRAVLLVGLNVREKEERIEG